MCVIEVKTHTHSDGRRSRRDKVRYCHEGIRRGTLCDHVGRKDTASASASNSSSSRPSSSADVVTVGKDGKERRYHRLGKHGFKRSSLGTSSANTRRSSDATSPPSTPPLREARPSPSHDDRPYRRSIKYSYAAAPEPDRTVVLDGTAIYERPPSLEMPRAGGDIERASSTTQPSLREVSPTRRPSQRRPRPSPIFVDTGASMTDTTSSIKASSPGLSKLPRLRQETPNDLPLRDPKGKYHARVDSLADDDEFEIISSREHEDNERQANLEKERLAASEKYQQERVSREINARDLEQARVERERMAEAERRQVERVKRQVEAQDKEQARLEQARLAESDRRQTERLRRQAAERDEDQARREKQRLDDSDRRQQVRLSQQAEAQARARAEEASRERHRQEAAAALERAEEDAEHKRRVDAEYAQMARERSTADAYKAAAATGQYQYYEPRTVPVSPRGITYANVPTTTISARRMTDAYVTSPPISARYPVTVHNNYSTGPNDSLRERGDAVIAQAQAAAAQNATQSLSSSIAGMGLQDDELDAVIDARMQRSSSRRQPRDVRERERVRERGYERQYYRS